MLCKCRGASSVVVEKNKRSRSVCCVVVVDVAGMSRRSLEEVKTSGQRDHSGSQGRPVCIYDSELLKGEGPTATATNARAVRKLDTGTRRQTSTCHSVKQAGRQTAAESKFERQGAANLTQSRFSKPCLAGGRGREVRRQFSSCNLTPAGDERQMLPKLNFAGF